MAWERFGQKLQNCRQHSASVDLCFELVRHLLLFISLSAGFVLQSKFWLLLENAYCSKGEGVNLRIAGVEKLEQSNKMDVPIQLKKIWFATLDCDWFVDCRNGLRLFASNFFLSKLFCSQIFQKFQALGTNRVIQFCNRSIREALKKNTGLFFWIFLNMGWRVFPIPKTQNQKKCP